MDCPSRERTGWLCDSLFTSRVAPDLTGTTVVEKAFFENFLLPTRFEHLPDGMLPMCYPADHYDGVFIPNWSLFFVIQLEEYLARSGDQVMVDALRGRIMRLMDYFKRFENEDGLLEKLESWVFVEWSAANQFVQDVNYPSNMLYAAALAATGRMYGDAALSTKAEKIRDVIRHQSFDGQFFVDNAVRKDGKLEMTRNRSEVCQYFAFFFDVASLKTHGRLWKTLRDEFGPDRKETKAHPEVHMANSFIGNMLRMELLSRAGHGQQILDESIAYLLYMAQRTGTLWENVGADASCDHGFASHIVHTLNRDILGVYQIDPRNRVVRLRFGDVDLTWCEGRIPLADGELKLRWEKGDNTLRYRLSVPDGYRVQIDNRSDRELVRMK
jgi:alpha-L-rhamnosidase